MIVTYSPSGTTSGNLWWEIQTYASNYETQFILDIPLFVQAAEERIAHDVQLPLFRKSQSGTLTGSNPYLQLPTDFLSAFELAVLDTSSGTTNYLYLINKDVNFIREAYPVQGVLGTPAYYAQFDYQTLIVGPTPDAGYSIELHYQYLPASITTASTSWLGTNFGAVLLWGSIREAYVYMKGEKDILDMYEGRYQEGLNLLRQLGDGKLRRDAYRDGQLRLPVQ